MKTFIHEEAYRGKELLKKIAEKNIILCGVGAVGSNLADNLVRQGFKSLAVIDFDRVEDHNRNTQIWDSRCVGQKKVAAMRNHLFNVMKVAAEPIDKKLTATNVKRFLTKGSIVIDGFDNSGSRGLVYDYCQSHEIDCIHIGLAEDCAEVTWNDRYVVPKKEIGLDVCEYPLARNTVMMAVIVGTESLIRYIATGVQENYIISMGNFKITKV